GYPGPACRPPRRPAADPARRAGRPGLDPRAGRTADCRRPAAVPRRSPWRDQFLRPLPHRRTRAHASRGLPRRILSGLWRQRPVRTRTGAYRGRGRRRGLAGAGVLPRPVRPIPSRHDRRPSPRTRHPRETGRPAGIGAGGLTMERILYVPQDTAALAMGADAVADAFRTEAARRGLSLRIVRNGSRGLLWLEPLVEIATPAGRVAYGPVAPADVPSILDAIGTDGAPDGRTAHPLYHGPTDKIPYLKNQERLTFARVGLIDPLSIPDYEARDGFAGLRKALDMPSEAIVDAIVESGLRGRGGAAFPTGIKWRTVLQTPSAQKYIVCNADEGDSGTFSDRMLMEGDPCALIEGMAIAGLAVGATRGYIYIRSEYPQAERILAGALQAARTAGWLGDDIQGSGRAFDIELRRGAGAYICGEETSLLESLEGRRGLVRAKPPLPAVRGLFGCPT